MIFKVYKTLLMLQIVGTTIVGLMFFKITGMIIGFIAGVLIAGHFLTTLSTREINAENTKILKGLLEETKKLQESLNNKLPVLPDPNDKK